MKSTLSLVVFICIYNTAGYSQNISQAQKVENIKTFAKLYGYVRYFHPSDEAAKMNWNSFALYGCQQVENCSSPDELVKILNILFTPIAPSIKVYKTNEKLSFDVNTILPKEIKNYKQIYWQHFGLNDSSFKKSVYKSIRINRTDSPALFDFHPQIGECTYKEIGNELSCIVPLCLYGNKKYTYPQSDSEELKKLTSIISKMDLTAKDKSLHLANLVITYNVLQHFYPYFDVVKTNWSESFNTALNECYASESVIEYFNTLKKFTAQLKDGHVRVFLKGDSNLFMPAIKWELIEKKLVITKVLSDSIQIPIGSVVEKINGLSSNDYLATFTEIISAATKSSFNHRLASESLIGYKKDSLELLITKPDGKQDKIKLSRYLKASDYRNQIKNKTQVKLLSASPKTIYINIDEASMDDINNVMPQLKEASAIICDLRGYPNSNHAFIQHLLKADDTASSWMRTPKIIYPDYQVSGFSNHSWKLTTKQPHLNAKIIFIIDGTAISYAESFMGFIEGYKLATIVGEPTAGTNGNVNTVYLLGGYQFRFTGMKVVRHNGKQQHGVGILPDVYVEKTIKGIIEGKDEFLDKALELAK